MRPSMPSPRELQHKVRKHPGALTLVPASPAVVKAADAAWARYASACRLGGSVVERQASYKAARRAELKLWQAQRDRAAQA